MIIPLFFPCESASPSSEGEDEDFLRGGDEWGEGDCVHIYEEGEEGHNYCEPHGSGDVGALAAKGCDNNGRPTADGQTAAEIVDINIDVFGDERDGNPV